MPFELVCEYHPKANLISDWRAGDVICSDCGLVVQDRVIDVHSEWRSFASDDNNREGDRSRVGAVENESIQHESEKQANRVFSDILDRLGLASVKAPAQAIFHKLCEANLLRGRSTDQVIAVCIYMACRQEGIPRTFKELEAVGKTTTTKLQRAYNSIKAVLKEKRIVIADVQSVSCKQYTARFASRLLPMKSFELEKLAMKLCDRAMNINELSGKRPDTVAATSIYMASLTLNHNLSMQDVTKVSGVAASTIKSTYKIMNEKKLNRM